MGTEIGIALRAHREALVRHLREHADGVPPEPGSDAALLLDALCGQAPEDYAARLEISGGHLAGQGGRLEERLAGIRRCSALLSEQLEALLVDDPRTLAQAQRYLADLVAEAVLALTNGYQAVRSRTEIENAERAQRGINRLRALQTVNAVANSAMDLEQTLATAARAVAREIDRKSTRLNSSHRL